MKTIKQLSEELKISKEAIYKKIKQQLNEPLKDHVTKLNNVTHIDSIGEQIIIQSLSRERIEAIQGVMNSSGDISSYELANDLQSENLPHVKEYIRLLQEQVKTKDIQINIQNNHITQLINQLGNGQLLLKNEQYKNILSLQRKAVVTHKPRQKNALGEIIWETLIAVNDLALSPPLVLCLCYEKCRRWVDVTIRRSAARNKAR